MLPGKLDGLGKMAWLAITSLAFATAWPFGLAMLAYLAGSGRLQAWCAEHAGAPGAWFDMARSSPAFGSGQRGRAFHMASNGHEAFDHRSEALSRLEKGQREFHAQLERPREARDKAEFRTFMAERQQRIPKADMPA